ncbi:hypothetical protein [Leminorella grimontii]|uniref:hypothetical protein n=1 Tax=Leminorella grimontii TaxID=82981 RepID=UPI00207F1A45|nr:hypothetical protein [Leminorella grimontii]GKX58546.1 hypothetical protein SOASR031_08610 [Leminorella grimontii]
MKIIAVSGLLLLAFLLPNVGYSHIYRGLEDDRTNDVKHGLYEINEEAEKFLVEEEARTHIKRKSLGPNLKVVVAPCAVPLKSGWAPKSMGLSVKYTVLVSCERSEKGQYGDGKGWRVGVPTALLDE